MKLFLTFSTARHPDVPLFPHDPRVRPVENANLNPFETAWYQDATPVFNVHGTNCTCAPDPVLLNPSCILCICGSQKPFSYGGATFKRTCGITKGCPTKLNYVNGYSSSCACAPDPLLRGNKWVMCSCPRLPTAKFPPIPSTYTSWPAMNKTSPKFSDWPVCNAPYALCSFANCTLDFKGKEKSPILMAECGCVLPFSQNKLPPRFSLVDPAYILDRRLFRQYKRECPEGKKTSVRCAAPNGTSICRQIAKNTIYGGKYDYVSTYSVSKESGGFNEACNAVDPVDQMYAQCSE